MGEIFDVFGLDLRILTLQAINFGLVLLVLWYFLYKPLTAMIEKRRKDTIEAVANAERAANDVKEADTKRKEILTEANLEAEKIVMSARQNGKEKEAQIISDAQERGEKMLADAKQQGEESKRQYIAQSKEEIAKLIVLGVEKTLKNQ